MQKAHKARWLAKGNRFVSMALVFVLTFMLLSFSCWSCASAGSLSNVEMSNYSYAGRDYLGIDQAAKSVFYVEVYGNDGTPFATGSGFVMFNEGLFITNQHVIDNASFLVIVDDDGRQYMIDQVIISDREHDIAILLFPEGKNYQSLAYDTSFDQLTRGQPVLTIGSPKGLPGTVSDGIISAFPKLKDGDIRYIQITAPISHGSSGGCLLNEDLKVIGVTSSGIEEGQNLGFAIPIFIVEQLYQQWNKTGTVALGTPSSWDTVGAGINDRISGSADKPKSSTGTNQPASSGSGTQEATSRSTVQLAVKWDPNAGYHGAYVLQVGGQFLKWDMDIREAVNLCTQNGLAMEYVDGDGCLQYMQDITFGQTMKLNPDIYSFYLDQGANQAVGKLNAIRLYFIIDDDLDAVSQKAQEIYEKLQVYLGITEGKIRIYHDSEFADVQGNNMKSAIEQMRRIAKDDYAFVTAGYQTLTLYVVTYDKHTYSVYINLSDYY